jgi:hypothetical protein
MAYIFGSSGKYGGSKHAVRERTYLARVVCSLVDIYPWQIGRIIIGPLANGGGVIRPWLSG